MLKLRSSPGNDLVDTKVSTRKLTNMYNISLERCSYSVSTRVNYIQIHVEITEILQVKD